MRTLTIHIGLFVIILIIKGMSKVMGSYICNSSSITSNLIIISIILTTCAWLGSIYIMACHQKKELLHLMNQVDNLWFLQTEPTDQVSMEYVLLS